MANSIRSELDTFPNYNSLKMIEGDIRNFETSAKEALDDLKVGFLNLVQDQMEVIKLAYDELIPAINRNINNGDNNSIAEIGSRMAILSCARTQDAECRFNNPANAIDYGL